MIVDGVVTLNQPLHVEFAGTVLKKAVTFELHGLPPGTSVSVVEVAPLQNRVTIVLPEVKS